MTIEIEYFDDIGKLQADPRAAAALSQARTPFDRPEWWQLLSEECGLEPLIALAYRGRDSLVWPLARNKRTITSLANFYNFDTGPIGSQNSALLKAIARNLAEHADRLELGPMMQEESLLRVLFRTGWIAHVSSTQVKHHFWDEGRNYEEYLAERPGRLRTTLSRKTKKVETQISHAINAKDFDRYREIYQSSWKPAEASFGFWERFCAQEGAVGRLRFGMAMREGFPIAAQIWTVEDDVAYIHKLAHRPEAEAYSPGTVLTAALMRHVLDVDRVTMVDFGLGDEPYKRDWMEMQWSATTITAVRPAKPRNWFTLVKMLAKPLYRRLVRARDPGYAADADLER